MACFSQETYIEKRVRKINRYNPYLVNLLDKSVTTNIPHEICNIRPFM